MKLKLLKHLKKNKLYQDAVIRKMEIIGEAASNISKSFKDRYSNVPWRLMKDMRNRLIHAYFGVDLSIIWYILTNEIPVLHEEIKKIIKDLN